MTHTQTIILAGGEGTRLHSNRPKALTTVGDRPIIDHQLALLATQGLTHISIALGSQLQPFVDHFGIPVQSPDSNPSFNPLTMAGQSLFLRLLSTGAGCDTGGRLKRMAAVIDQPFLLSWCDFLCDLDLAEFQDFHARSGLAATVLAVHPPARFGYLQLEQEQVVQFQEKPVADDDWINGGLFVLNPSVLDRISADESSFERDVLPGLAKDGQLQAWRHEGFWHCMDTPAERRVLDQFLREGNLA